MLKTLGAVTVLAVVGAMSMETSDLHATSSIGTERTSAHGAVAPIKRLADYAPNSFGAGGVLEPTLWRGSARIAAPTSESRTVAQILGDDEIGMGSTYLMYYQQCPYIGVGEGDWPFTFEWYKNNEKNSFATGEMVFVQGSWAISGSISLKMKSTDANQYVAYAYKTLTVHGGYNGCYVE